MWKPSQLVEGLPVERMCPWWSSPRPHLSRFGSATNRATERGIAPHLSGNYSQHLEQKQLEREAAIGLTAAKDGQPAGLQSTDSGPVPPASTRPRAARKLLRKWTGSKAAGGEPASAPSFASPIPPLRRQVAPDREPHSTPTASRSLFLAPAWKWSGAIASLSWDPMGQGGKLHPASP